MYNNDEIVNFLIFILILILALSLEYLFKRVYFSIHKEHYKTNHFTLGKYIYYLILPALVVIYFTRDPELNAPMVFISFALLGTFAEWLIGFSYHKIVGQRLWTYHRYSMGKYTSLLSIPLWGVAGLIFMLFAQIFE